MHRVTLAAVVLVCTLPTLWAQDDKDDAARRAELAEHLKYFFYPEDMDLPDEPWREKRRIARRRVPELVTSADVRIFADRIRAHKWEKRADPKGNVAINALNAMELLRDYYIRTQDKKVEDLVIEILDDAEYGRVRLLSVLTEWVDTDPKAKKGGDAPLKALQKTPLIERIYGKYRTFDKLESRLQAANFLVGMDTYREEMIWYFCTVLKDDDAVVSEAHLRHYRKRSGIGHLTARDVAQVMAFGMLSMPAHSSHDKDLFRDYVIPWDKTLNKNRRLRLLVGHTEDSPLVFLLRYGVETTSVPAGQPVPPKPDTVVEPPAAGNDPTGQPDARD